MKRILGWFVLALLVGFLLLNLSGDVRAGLGWFLTLYLVVRALPAMAGDFRYLRSRIRLRGFRGLRRSKVDTL